MAANTKIQWCDATFNHVRGCSKVSEACRNCYAETLSKRNPKTLGVWGPMGTRVVASESMWREPVKWNRQAGELGERHRVFCASLADVFEDWQGPMVNSDGEKLWKAWNSDTVTASETRPHARSSPLTMSDVRTRLFRLIDATPNLDWLLLTKRPQNIAEMMPPAVCPSCKGKGGWETGPHSGDCRCVGATVVRHNVWLGTTVENQQAADERIPHLLKVPAVVRFLSCEPLLGEVELFPRRNAGKYFPGWKGAAVGPKLKDYLHWVIVGGESGHHARPMHRNWAISLLEQCKSHGIAFHFKQHGEYLTGKRESTVTFAGEESIQPTDAPCGRIAITRCRVLDDEYAAVRVGTKDAGRTLDGRTWDELPTVSR